MDNGGLFSSRAELVGVLALAGFDAWTFSVFFTVIIWAISMYVLALALYPPRLSKDVDYRVMIETNRTWFLSTFAARFFEGNSHPVFFAVT